MMQILNFMFNKRLYPVWIAGLTLFNLANGDVIAIQDGNHSWGGNSDHQITYSLNPAEFAESGFPDPKLPDPNVAIESDTLISVQAAVREACKVDYEFPRKSNPYLLYLLKRPPPPAYPAV